NPVSCCIQLSGNVLASLPSAISASISISVSGNPGLNKLKVIRVCGQLSRLKLLTQPLCLMPLA
ncbi:MAG: hypothetical protein ACRC1W_08165, partial [Shewanella sp.]